VGCWRTVSPNAGTYRGRAAVVAYLRDWMESLGRSEHTIEEMVAADDWVMGAVRISIHGSTSGVGFDAPLYFVERVREGAIDRVRVFYERDEALAALSRSRKEKELGAAERKSPEPCGFRAYQ
jgi:ketosteroid isomerase-like protein